MASDRPRHRVLLSSIDAFGHINCALAFGELLAQGGHEVTFLNRESYRDLALKRGFKFIPLDEAFFDGKSQPWLAWTERNMKVFSLDVIQRMTRLSEADKEMASSFIEDYRKLDLALDKALDENKDSFDILVGDFFAAFPSLDRSPIPYIPLISPNPLSLYLKGPPPFSGYPIDVDSERAENFRNLYFSSISVTLARTREWYEAREASYLLKESCMVDEPKHFGFYHYPELLDYSECGPKISAKWIRIDALIRQPENVFELPKALASRPGKLIYFSLGSLGSADVHLMKKMIGILAESPHRFIVSKGPRGDEIDLPDNMWGANYVNQIEILKMVDMAIIHGGNNSFLETLYFGKPLIVLPFFWDQFDNAQRVVDCGIGRRLDTWSLDESQVLKAIEETLNDTQMAVKIKSISASMRSSQSRSKAVQMIEGLIQSRNETSKSP